MSFAQDLLNTSQAAQAAQRAARLEARDAFVQRTLERFKQCCQTQAKNGATSCSLDVDEPRNAGNALEVLNQQLQELGFESVSVKLKPPYVQPRKVLVSASWGNLQPQRTETGPPPQGMISSCPICCEDRPLVALMPCGHTVCNRCQQSVQLQCPMCRVTLTGATQGIFLS